jgi:hypothetical protein
MLGRCVGGPLGLVCEVAKASWGVAGAFKKLLKVLAHRLLDTGEQKTILR